MKAEEELSLLLQTAVQLGASDAAIIPPRAIVVEDELALLCSGDTRCKNYGLAASCPPYVSGPSAFRQWQESSRHAIVVRIDVPTWVIFSDERRDIMRLLHEIVAGVESRASALGYHGSKAFAGGSCKNLFCQDQTVCRVVGAGGQCRNPQFARPSMSGFGINVSRLMETAGWSSKLASRSQASDGESMTWIAGLILIARDGEPCGA